jgi:hypothetical protein
MAGLGAVPETQGPPVPVQLQRELARLQGGGQSPFDKWLSGINQQIAAWVRIGLFIVLLVCNGMVLMAQPEDRGSVKNQHLGFMGTMSFVLLMSSSLDGCFDSCGAGRAWVRPIKAAFYCPTYCLLVLLVAKWVDEYLAPFNQKIASPEGELCALVGELFLDGLLAEFCKWIINMLHAEAQGSSPIMVTATMYVLPVTLYVTQQNLRLRIEYLSSFLQYQGLR